MDRGGRRGSSRPCGKPWASRAKWALLCSVPEIFRELSKFGPLRARRACCRSPSLVRLDSRLQRVLHCADESSRGRPCACPFAFIGSGPRRSPYRSIRSGLPASSAELAHPPANARHDRQSQPRRPQACARTVAGRALRTPSRIWSWTFPRRSCSADGARQLAGGTATRVAPRRPSTPISYRAGRPPS